MKYSMTKNLYDKPETTTYQAYQYESTQSGQTGSNAYDSGQYEYSKDLETYNREGEYHVDYDP